jgi:ZIP family zinc transporter
MLNHQSVFVIGAIAGLATVIGALPIVFLKRITQRVQGILLGFGAGVMLAASCFSLIIPGIEAGTKLLDSEVGGVFLVSGGILLGGGFLWITNQWFPHEHFIKGVEGRNLANLKRNWLFITAIALHNFPEGLAVGVGFGNGDIANGTAIAIGIALQNLPEGLVTALALVTEKYSKTQALGVTLLTGLIEPIDKKHIRL